MSEEKVTTCKFSIGGEAEPSAMANFLRYVADDLEELHAAGTLLGRSVDYVFDPQSEYVTRRHLLKRD